MCSVQTTVMVITTDDCGNDSSQEFTFTIEDTTPPAITAVADGEGECEGADPSANSEYLAWLSDNAGITATDLCSDIDISYVEGPWTAPDVCTDQVSVTFTVADDCGNSTDLTYTFTITDETDPFIIDNLDGTAECEGTDPNLNSAYLTWLGQFTNATTNEVCGNTSISYSASGVWTSVGVCSEQTTVTVTTTDDCGNDSSQDFTFTITDTEPPTIVAGADGTGECEGTDHDANSEYQAWLTSNAGITATDLCSNVTITPSPAGWTSPDVCTYENVVTFTIEDECGNSTDLTYTFNITDTTDPFIINGSNGTAECQGSDPNLNTDYITWRNQFANASTNDVCGNSTLSYTEGAWNIIDDCTEQITVTVIATDDCGLMQTEDFTFTITDTRVPTASNPAPVTVECIADVPLPDISVVTDEADNCSVPVVVWIEDVSDGGTCPTIITRTYSVTDDCGNSITVTQDIVINDLVPPTLTCPGDLTAVCDISEQPAYSDYAAFTAAGGTATDNCGIDESSFTLLSETSDGSCPETVTRTYQIADLCGNLNTCVQLIVIDDDEVPTLTCPGDLTAVCDISEQPAYSDYAAFTAAGGTATDNCGIDESSFTLLSETSDGSCPETVTRTYQIADLCGNLNTCVQLIVIDDDEVPTLTCPGDLTAVCDISEQPAYSDYAAFTAAGGTATDNCGIDESSFTLLSETSDGSCPETVTRTYQIADLCGNLNTCVQLIVIDDDEVPTLTCPGDLTAVCDISEQPAYSDYAAFTAAGGTATDNCGIDESSFTLLSETSDGSCPETVTRTYQIADLCGNLNTCVQLIVIDDDEVPTLTCPGDLTAVCDISEQPAYSDYAAFTAAGGTATDNCGIDESSFTLLSETSDGSCPETVTRTYQIADLCGNLNTCVQLIVIDDDEVPTLTCPGDLTAVCDISEQPAYSDYAAFTAAGGTATDNCGIDESSFTLLSETSDGSCPETVTRTYQIADLCGNLNTCVQLIVIDDDEVPTLTCPGDLTAVCDISEQPAYSDYAAFTAAGGTATDNCGIDESSFTLLSETSDGSCPETVTRTYQIADLCGNLNTCVQLIVIDDDEVPTLTCPGDLTAVCDISEQPAYSDYAAFTAAGGTATDNCGIDESSFTLLSETSDGSCPETVTRTYQIADLCGNLNTCVQLIVIDDDEVPTLTCPGDLTAVCDISEQPAYSDYAAFTAAGGTATDNCGIDESSFTLLSETSDGSCPETVTRTYQIADLCGNLNTCVQLIVIDDDEVPTLTCPGDLTAVCDISEQPAYSDYAAFTAAGGTATDNCGIDESSFTLLSETSDGSCPETVTRTYQIADLCGNLNTCVQLIVIDDDEVPTLTCPGDLTAVCDISEQPAYSDYAAFTAAGGTATDNCGIDESSFTLLSETSDGSCPETVTRTYQIADLCGNLNTCVQLIVIDDDEVPTLTCPGDLTAVCDISEQPAYSDYAAFTAAGGTATDNCGIDESSFTLLSETSDGSCPETVTRTYQIADLCGNLNTCVQLIVIDDDEVPTLTCPGDLTAVCDISEQPAYSDYAAFTAAGGTATDNCGIDESSFTLLSETSDGSCPETVTRTYQIADLCGNLNTCVQLIVIDDDEVPTLTCPGDLTAVCDISEQPAYSDYAAFTAAGGTATDNCGIDESSFTLLSETSDGSCPETVTRTYQIADLCGNLNTCVQLIVIDDDEVPTLTCPGDLTAVCDISEQPAYSDYAAFTAAGGTATDNCGIDESSFTLLSETSDGSCPETVTRTYQIADLCGNLNTCVQLIVIDDDEVPTLTCPGDLTAVCDISEQPAYSDYAAFTAAGGTATDNCGIDESSFTLLSETSDGSCPETVTRTYQIADLCGNLNTCVQLIVIDDDEVPTLTCPGDLTAVCDISEQPAYSDYAAFTAAGGTATDNCGIDESSFTLLSETSDGSCPETVTRTYQIADLCGNLNTCVQLIVIDDDEVPTLTCPGDLTAVCDISEQPAYSDYAAFTAAGGTATDNCGIDESSFTLLSETSDGSCPETVTRTYQIADLCGNLNTCVQLIVIDDDEVPTLTCPGDLTAVCDISEQPAYSDYAAFTAAGGTATDNCGIDESSFTLLSETSDGSCPETVTRTYQIADLCGNLNTCVQLIVIDDDEVDADLSWRLDVGCEYLEQPAYSDYAVHFTAAV